MIYRRPGFLVSRMIRFYARSLRFPPSPISKYLSLPVCCRSCLLTGGGGRGTESYDRKKAWPSVIVQCSLLETILLDFYTLYMGPDSEKP
jgi:hypothetical protein